LRDAWNNHRNGEVSAAELSSQCGFASTIGGNPVTSDDQRRKLELLMSVSDEVWGSA